MRSKSFLNVLAQKEILVSAYLDDIAEEVYRQMKHPPLKLEHELMMLATVIETHAEMNVQHTPEYREKFRHASIRVVSKLAIMALDL